MQGSGLARAPSVWYVDHRDDDAASGASPKLSRQGAVTSSVGPVAGSSDDVVRVHARCEGVSHRALAHPESREHDHLRDELARHVAAGGATVLVTPIVDPLIVDLSADAERDARATFDGDGDGYGSFASLSAPSTLTDHPPPRDRRAASSSRAPCVSATRTTREIAAREDSARTAPVVPCWRRATTSAGTSSTAPGAARGGGSCETAGALGDCAFARTIKEASATVAERNVYYAAVVQTASRVGVEATDALEETFAREGGDASVGYEEFLVYRPAGDVWIAGSVPPPTSVRRASFGPKLRRELATLSAERRR